MWFPLFYKKIAIITPASWKLRPGKICRSLEIYSNFNNKKTQKLPGENEVTTFAHIWMAMVEVEMNDIEKSKSKTYLRVINVRAPKIQENSRKFDFSLFYKVKLGFSWVFSNFLEFSLHGRLTP